MASPSSFINSSTAAAMHQSGACGATIGCRSLHSRFASRCVCFRIAIRAVSGRTIDPLGSRRRSFTGGGKFRTRPSVAQDPHRRAYRCCRPRVASASGVSKRRPRAGGSGPPSAFGVVAVRLCSSCSAQRRGPADGRHCSDRAGARGLIAVLERDHSPIGGGSVCDVVLEVDPARRCFKAPGPRHDLVLAASPDLAVCDRVELGIASSSSTRVLQRRESRT